MQMVNLLPLVVYELRLAVRRPGAYRMRLAAGGAAIGLSCCALLISSDASTASSLGHRILTMLGWAGFVGSVLAGLFLTADSVSQERREGTLGLLFLTDLRGHDVVFGKLAAKGLAPFYSLLAMFPSLTVCMIVGAVTAGEVWRLSLVLINTLFFSLSLTILTSSFCRSQRAAQLSALLALLVSVAALPVLGQPSTAASGRSVSHSWTILLSPAGNYVRAFDPRYRTGPGWFWGSLATTHLLAWVCVAMAGRLLPRLSLEESFVRVARARGERARLGDVARRQHARGEVLSRNPIAWLASRNSWKQRLVWSLPVVAFGIGLGLDPNPGLSPVGPRSTGVLFAVHALFKIWLGADASHEFSTGRLNGTLEVLLSTPLQSREVAAGMLSAFSHRFLAPLLALLLVDAAVAVKFMSMNNVAGAAIIAACGTMLLIDSYCLCWVGLWRGLVARDSVRAVVATIWRVLILPWIGFAAGVAIFIHSTPGEFAGLWLFVGVITDVVLLVNAKDFFHRHFRAMALRPFGAKPLRVESKWSPINWEAETDGSSSARPAGAGNEL